MNGDALFSRMNTLMARFDEARSSGNMVAIADGEFQLIFIPSKNMY